MNLALKATTIATAGAIASSLGPAVSLAHTSHPSTAEYSLTASSPLGISGLRNVLTVINSIPDSVLQQGQKATQQWLQNRYGGNSSQSAFMRPSSLKGIVACGGSLAVFVGSNFAVFSKIFKIKAAIKTAKNVDRIIEGVEAELRRGIEFDKAVGDVFEHLGGGAVSAILDVVGAAGIIENC